MKLVFIGGGNMASALIGGLINKGIAAADICVIDPSAAARDRVTETFGINTLERANTDALTGAVCVIAVKPQQMQVVAQSLANLLNDTLIVSVAAGIRASDLGHWLGDYQRIVRAMPNTPAMVGFGMTGLWADQSCSEQDRNDTAQVLNAVGATIWVDTENAIDAVTAISGSGPAYVFRWMEAMQQAGCALGLSQDQANTLVAHTIRGASELALRSDESVATLRNNVTSKGGTTAAGLNAMNAGDILGLIGNGVRAAHARSIEMGDEFGRNNDG